MTTDRLPRIAPADMTAEQTEIYRRYDSGRRAEPSAPFTLVHAEGGLIGPPNAWLRSPPLGRALEPLGEVLRFELQFSDRSREIAILLVGFHHNSPFELYAHRRAGRAAGLRDDEIEGLAQRAEPDFRSDEERAVFGTTLAVLDRGTLDDEQYRAAVAILGERGLFELLTLVGWYNMLAVQLAVFAVEPPS